MDLENSSSLNYLLKSLKGIRKNKRLAHAYIITGDNLDYMKDFTKHWLKICLCYGGENKESESDIPCELCKACLTVEHNTYPYKFELKPRSKSRMVTVDNLREFEHHYHIKVPKGYLRVGIIWEADRMVVEAQNTFLKTLEEPPPNSLIILVTKNINKLLPTIVSRCQLIAIRNNKYLYDFAGNEELFNILADVKPYSGALTGLNASMRITKLFSSLKKDAERKVLEKDENNAWKELAENDRHLRKDLDEQKKALVESEYLAVRNQFIDAIHCWYSQVFLISSGISFEEIPNPEIFESRKPDWLNNLTPQITEPLLELADTFLQTLSSTQLKESMAIDDFFLQITKKV